MTRKMDSNISSGEDSSLYTDKYFVDGFVYSSSREWLGRRCPWEGTIVAGCEFLKAEDSFITVNQCRCYGGGWLQTQETDGQVPKCSQRCIWDYDGEESVHAGDLSILEFMHDQYQKKRQESHIFSKPNINIFSRPNIKLQMAVAPESPEKNGRFFTSTQDDWMGESDEVLMEAYDEYVEDELVMKAYNEHLAKVEEVDTIVT